MNNSEQTVSRAVAGPVRTLVQLAPSAVITEVIDVFFYDFDDRQYAAFGALLLMLFSVGQNAYEARKGKAFLR